MIDLEARKSIRDLEEMVLVLSKVIDGLREELNWKLFGSHTDCGSCGDVGSVSCSATLYNTAICSDSIESVVKAINGLLEAVGVSVVFSRGDSSEYHHVLLQYCTGDDDSVDWTGINDCKDGSVGQMTKDEFIKEMEEFIDQNEERQHESYTNSLLDRINIERHECAFRNSNNYPDYVILHPSKKQYLQKEAEIIAYMTYTEDSKNWCYDMEIIYLDTLDVDEIRFAYDTENKERQRKERHEKF